MAKNKMYDVGLTPSKSKKKIAESKSVTQLIASNKRARHDYAIDDVLEAGLVLTGTEVKALRAGRASLIDAYVAIDRGEAWLEAAHISEYAQGTWTNHAPRRKRKLLLHRSEIMRLDQRVREKGFTIVPLSLYFKDGRVKVEIGVGRGKKEWDKRQTLRERQDDLEARRAMRYRELG